MSVSADTTSALERIASGALPFARQGNIDRSIGILVAFNHVLQMLYNLAPRSVNPADCVFESDGVMR